MYVNPSKTILRLHCHAIPWRKKKLFENHSVDRVKKLWCYRRLIKILKSVRFPKPQIFLEIFWTNLQSPVWSRLVRSTSGTLILWLSRWLIVCTEQTSIYISSFYNTLTSELTKNHDISKCFSANTFVGLRHAPPLLWNSCLSCLRKGKNKQQQWQRLRKINWNVYRLI